jgi:hypothetical protein
VKNLPIVGKILTVLGAFGVFVIAVSFYATSQMRGITNGFEQLDKTTISAQLSMDLAHHGFQGAHEQTDYAGRGD